MTARRLGLRTRVALTAGRAARVASRLRGGGSAFPGLVSERLDPQILGHTLGHLEHGVVLVSGTNGKTTTTKMLAHVLRAHGLRVFSNPTGSNFVRGVISSLLGEVSFSGRLDADIAVLELDEAHAIRFIEHVRPRHALLLNVARDQLDRFAEIDATAILLGQVAAQTSGSVVLNADDSFIARIRPQVPEATAVAWFRIDPEVAGDLPAINEADVREADDLDIPAPAPGDVVGELHPLDERAFEVRLPDTTVDGVRLRQRGLAAMINATAATTTARSVLGDRFDAATTAAALAAVTPPFGRGEVIDVDGHPLELVLVKNPAGFTVALGTYGSEPVATMIAINDDYADGRDVSWLYDVSFESLRERGVARTAGVRAYDMALRLQYDDVATDAVEPDLDAALDAFLAEHPGEPRRIFCTYTAMMALRRRLAARFGLSRIGEEPA